MAVAVGLQTVIGYVDESVYGTPVTVNKWTEFLSENLQRRQQILASDAIRPGPVNARRGGRREINWHDAGGDLTIEVPRSGAGFWLKHALGGTPVSTQQGATPAYLHEFELGSVSGLSFTVQKGLRDEDQTAVETFTYPGCKINGFEFSIGVDQYLQLRLTVDAREERSNIALASPTLPVPELFSFKQGTLNVDGSPVAVVSDASVGMDRGLIVDRRHLGATGLKSEPVQSAYPGVSGSLTADFDDPATFYDLFVADTSAELVLEFEADVISGAFNELLTITVPDTRFTGSTPTVGSPEIVTHTVPFEGFADATNTPALQVAYMSTDTSV